MGINVFPVPSTSFTEPGWTQLGYSACDGSNTVTISNISGYRTLRVVLINLRNTLSNDATDVSIRFNSDSTSSYGYFIPAVSTSAYTMNNSPSGATNKIQLNRYLAADAGTSPEARRAPAVIDIFSADSNEKIKVVKGWNGANNSLGNSYFLYEINGFYKNSGSAITSVSIIAQTGNFATVTSPDGFYVYGAN
jgi:hypothetical protein